MMLPDFIKESQLWGSLFALGVLVAMLLVAAIAEFVFQLILKHRKKVGSPGLPTRVIRTFKGPIVLFLVIVGPLLSVMVLTALTSSTWGFLESLDIWTRRSWSVVIIFEVAYLVAQLSQTLFAWYIRAIAARTKLGKVNRLLPPIRRVLPILIYAVATLVALDSIDIAISPLLAGFGIGGLAIALAIQPTLSNFFAGTYLVTEGEINEGDFIELEGGPSGYVVDVGWRSTKVRSRFNNLIIIPNSQMMNSILTNYYSPTPAMNVIINCGVSYDSDLTEVERLVLEVVQEAIDESQHAVKDVEPFFGFSEFGDSNIDFFVFIQANDRMGSFILKSEVIKKIHARFEKEGIEINYPVRRLIHSNPDDESSLMETEDS